MRLQGLRWPSATFVLSLLCAACAGATTPQSSLPTIDAGATVDPADAAGGVTDGQDASEPIDAGEADAVAAGEPAGRPDWQQVELTDVRTGETFTLGDFQERVVIVEAMAVWCPLCDQQQFQIKSALGELRDDVATVSLDIDPSETADILARHANDLELPWHFVIAGPELASMLQREFGPQILTPPSTPVLIIAPNGETILTPFGIKGWDELIDFATPLMP